MTLFLVVSFIVLNAAWGSPDPCDKRYLQHYAVKDCTPVYGKDPKCPVRYQCPEHYAEENKKGCVYHGQLYKEGDSVPVSNPCQICDCRRQYSTKSLDIDCFGIDCPSVFRGPLNSSCYDVHEEGKCCSTGIKCTKSKDGKPSAQEKVCIYKNKTYHLGQEIYSDEDPCQSCLCTKEWTNIKGKGCHSYDCDLDQDRTKIRKGCLPIYHEATCCPIQYFCGDAKQPKDEKYKPPSSQDIRSGNTCSYKGVHYSLGQHIEIENEPCVTCTCSIPPDFTCIHKKCPTPEKLPGNCRMNYNPGECCPTISCVL